jgi:glycosyltransferase involved in cell wall biosynthesis
MVDASTSAHQEVPLILYLGINDWSALWQRPQHLGVHLAEHYRLLYAYPRYVRDWLCLPPHKALGALATSVEPWSPRLTLLQPVYWLPRRIRLFGRGVRPWFSRVLRRHLRRHDDWPGIVWVSHPRQVELLDAFPGCPVCYDCMDHYAAFAEGQRRSRLEEQERALLSRADVVLATSQGIMERAQRTARWVELVPNGVEWGHFAQATTRSLPRPEELDGLAGQVIGYYGTIASWFDWDLIVSLAARHPEWDLLLIGPVRYRPDHLPGNVRLLGRRPYEALPSYLQHVDVWLYPFRRVPLVEEVDPVKIYEYIAAGRRVVATRTKETSKFAPWVALCDGLHEFEGAIEDALASPAGPEQQAAMQAFARANTWERRGAQVVEILNRLLH